MTPLRSTNGSTLAYFAAMTGQTVTGGREQVCADQATEDQAAALGIDAGAAVMLTCPRHPAGDQRRTGQDQASCLVRPPARIDESDR